MLLLFFLGSISNKIGLMNQRIIKRSLSLSCLIFYTGFLPAQTPVDSGLLQIINELQAIDNHCHDQPIPAEPSIKYDPKNPLGKTEYPMVYPLRVDYPGLIQAWDTLYGYTYTDFENQHIIDLIKRKEQIRRERMDHYPEWVLDKLHIQTACVCNNHLGKGQENPSRFRWVNFADPLLFPLETKTHLPFETLTWDGWGGEEILHAVRLKKIPATLNSYCLDVINPLFKQWKEQGVLAIKLAVAYIRSLEFEKVDLTVAQEIYERYIVTGNPPDAAYKKLQDYLMWYIAWEAGELGIPLQFHTGNGDGPFFNNGNANPALLENLIDDPAMRKTTFVLLHGGWPFEKLTAAMLDKPNVYCDFSAVTFYLTAHQVSEMLRTFLEFQPEKILFGTDAEPNGATPLFDWEETGWLSNHTARHALAEALTAMILDKEITREKAVEIAHWVLHDNAAKLYHLP
jgi:uncharacterized protein